jgi:hypothetical protein
MRKKAFGVENAVYMSFGWETTGLRKGGVGSRMRLPAVRKG